MTNSTKSNHYPASPESVNVNYRLQSIKALIDGLDHEMIWAGSNRKSVTLALLNHAMSNTEQDLSDALGYDASDEQDPWDFSSSSYPHEKKSNEPKCTQRNTFRELCDLVDLAVNHWRLNPLSDKREISELIIAELGEMGIKFVDGSLLAKAIDQAFAQREIKVHWAEEILADLNSKLIAIADQVLACRPNCSPADFREPFLKELAAAGLNLSSEQVDSTVDFAMLRQGFFSILERSRLAKGVKRQLVQKLSHGLTAESPS